MFKNLQIYRLPNFVMSAESLARQLAPHAFTPASSAELMRQGWAAPRHDDQLVHVVNGQYLLTLKTEKKLLPASVINQVAAARAAEMGEAQGFAPGKKAMKELKERVTDELLPRAFSLASATNVWIDPINGWLVVDAASPSKADEVIKMLLKSVDRLPLDSLRVQRSPVAAMTEWLQADDAPAGFTVDMDATMRATGESKATVQYKRHTLEAAELGRHIAAGKRCTRLAMTWDSKISFVLDESLSIKSVKALDVLAEKDVGARNDDERFDGDMMLMTGELAKMLADLVDALGGEAMVDAPGEQKAVPASTARPNIERVVGLSAELYKVRALHRDVLNDLYEKTVQPYIERVREQMAATGESEIKCAIELAKAQPTGSTSAQLLLVAAVEIIEPSPCPAKGDEPVRAAVGRLNRLLEADGATAMLTEPGVSISLGVGLASNAPAGDGSAADPLYEQAVAVVRTNQRASVSLVQRHLLIGYNHAARLIEAMEAAGVVGAMRSNGSREVLAQGGAA